MLTITTKQARRLAILQQLLTEPKPAPNAKNIIEVVRRLGCIQIDPINIVTPSHYLVLWSRLGQYNTDLLNTLLWETRQLFEDWGHCTSIVSTEDYPIFQGLKQTFSPQESFKKWIKENKKLERYILRELKAHGPLPMKYFDDKAVTRWESKGWTAGRNVSMMLTYLWAKGSIMVARREGNQKFYDLTQRVLPVWVSQERLTSRELYSRIAEKSLHALGVARPMHIRYYFIRGIPEQVHNVLEDLESRNRIKQIQIKDLQTKTSLRGKWYIHTNEIPLLDELDGKHWHPRTVLLSPFDNLIYDRKRLHQLFRFRYSMEIYVPKHKQKYGYYVLPILYHDQFIGRIDPAFDRRTQALNIKSIHKEPQAPTTKPVIHSIRKTIRELAAFINAQTIIYPKRIPSGWEALIE